MAAQSIRLSASLDVSAAAIRRLALRGYEATTAGDLADAVGISRSTFFRRFGSKDDVVFADHDHAVAQLSDFLETTEMLPGDALVEGTTDVLRLLTRDPEAAHLRFELLRHTPSLRDRELIITHRYERVSADYLRRVVDPSTPDWVPTALASAIVAVHNATFRDWLRGNITDAPRAAASSLRQLTSLFDGWLSPQGDAKQRRVLVAVYEANGSSEAVLGAVAAQLER